jgi:hydroxycarboxylate dehydrogenase B
MSKVLIAPVLEQFIATILEAAGSSTQESQTVAANLVMANLSGHDSHGVGMVPRYVDAVLEGGLVPNNAIKVNLDIGTMLSLDGQRGYGQVVGEQAMQLAIERARLHGSCIMTLANAHHLGRIGHFAEMAVAQGLVALHFVNVLSRPVVAAWGGGDGRFGTNPVCIGIPLHGAGRQFPDGPPLGKLAPLGGSATHEVASVGANQFPDGPPLGKLAPSGGSAAHEVASGGAHNFVLDFATSRVAQGKMRVAYNKGEQVALGTLIDEQGRPTTNPGVVVVPQRPAGSPPNAPGLFGALLPFGEHKGYGLAVACELLGGALSGGDTWHKATDPAVRAVINGMLTILIDPVRLGTQARFESEASAFVDWLQSGPVAPGFESVQLAGCPERAYRAHRQVHGIEIDDGTWAELVDAGAKVGVALPVQI